MKSLLEELREPRRLFQKVINRYPGLLRWMDDETYLRLFYRMATGRRLNLQQPQTFNEKLQWLKLHDRRDIYTTMVDKCGAKRFVSERIGAEYVIPTLGVWDSFEEIDLDSLPVPFVLKCTHDSGGLVVCTDRRGFDREAARRKINRRLRHNFYGYGREWPYKNVRPRIIAEPYLREPDGSALKDYKLFCFGGVPRMTLVCSGRFGDEGLREDFYGEDWEPLPLRRPGHAGSDAPVPRPGPYERMKAIAARLSEGIPFARIDLYLVGDRVYFGEITLYPTGGFEGFCPEEADLRLGRLIALPGEREKGGAL